MRPFTLMEVITESSDSSTALEWYRTRTKVPYHNQVDPSSLKESEDKRIGDYSKIKAPRCHIQCQAGLYRTPNEDTVLSVLNSRESSEPSEAILRQRTLLKNHRKRTQVAVFSNRGLFPDHQGREINEETIREVMKKEEMKNGKNHLQQEHSSLKNDMRRKARRKSGLEVHKPSHSA
ncbi:hypothetical protein PRIPAC_72752 [Pristionchus pacificus]|uniref:Uncharacterized protein n=1 Tax=Pristionchus pacificus TaxID=54126 RepID=A0A2A6BFH7_PRIPA|nr:hypothetical protein PRIPAC_72752 [Pristionchus pacificus]|eukprot:PDM64616.1 hypothetical protein PRIPAC_52872 [Pristionchus pacificus]